MTDKIEIEWSIPPEFQLPKHLSVPKGHWPFPMRDDRPDPEMDEWRQMISEYLNNNLGLENKYLTECLYIDHVREFGDRGRCYLRVPGPTRGVYFSPIDTDGEIEISEFMTDAYSPSGPALMSTDELRLLLDRAMTAWRRQNGTADEAGEELIQG